MRVEGFGPPSPVVENPKEEKTQEGHDRARSLTGEGNENGLERSTKP